MHRRHEVSCWWSVVPVALALVGLLAVTGAGPEGQRLLTLLFLPVVAVAIVLVALLATDRTEAPDRT